MSLAAGLVMVSVGWTGWQHPEITIDARGVSYPTLGLPCRTVSVPWGDVRRWGRDERTRSLAGLAFERDR